MLRKEKQTEKKKGGLLKKLGMGFLVLVVIGIIVNSVNDKKTPVTEETKQATTTDVKETEQKTTAAKETTEPKKDASEPKVSKEYQNALKKAESYAKTMYMSKQGIYDQLTSEYGEGFPEDAAQYAIDTLVWDYKENAYQKAKSYQDMMSMSLNNIKDQLTSEYGEKFTEEEAEYAINKLSSEQ